ncbi:hypothetical protein BDV12DRAFT_163277 [Aspergillus spectabilis]
MHDITRQMARDSLNEADYQEWLVSAIEILLSYFPEKRRKSCSLNCIRGKFAIFGAGDPITLAGGHNLALCYANQGRLSESEPRYDRALETYTRLLEYDDLLSRRVRSNISRLYR